MSTAKGDSNRRKKPTADDLAGVPVCIEGDNPTLFSRKKSGRGPFVVPPLTRTPTADDLAGVPVCAEGEEDLTRRPRKRPKPE
jgi:hypothetical protein